MNDIRDGYQWFETVACEGVCLRSGYCSAFCSACPPWRPCAPREWARDRAIMDEFENRPGVTVVRRAPDYAAMADRNVLP
jgi:hypothetical protein